MRKMRKEKNEEKEEGGGKVGEGEGRRKGCGR
jgi:hypothetical protein